MKKPAALVIVCLCVLWSAGSAVADTLSDSVIVNGKQYFLTESQEANGLGIIASWTFTNPPPSSPAGVLLTDSGGVDDAIFYSSALNALVYKSAFKGPIQGNFSGFVSLSETGQLQDVSSFFGQTAGAVQVQSLAATPLPPTWTIMLIGLVGLGFMLYRKGSRGIVGTAGMAAV